MVLSTIYNNVLFPTSSVLRLENAFKNLGLVKYFSIQHDHPGPKLTVDTADYLVEAATSFKFNFVYSETLSKQGQFTSSQPSYWLPGSGRNQVSKYSICLGFIVLLTLNENKRQRFARCVVTSLNFRGDKLFIFFGSLSCVTFKKRWFT